MNNQINFGKFFLAHFFIFWLLSEKGGRFNKVLPAKPGRLTRCASGIHGYNTSAITGDRSAQKCETSTVGLPTGMGLVSPMVPTLYYPHRGFLKPALPVPVALMR